MDANLYTDDMVHRMLQDLIEGPEPSYHSSSSSASVGSIESGYGTKEFNALLYSPPGLSSNRPNTLETELNEMSDDFERFKIDQLQKLRSLEVRYNFKEFTYRQNDPEETQILRARVHELEQKSSNLLLENRALKEQVSTLQTDFDAQKDSREMLQQEVEDLKVALSLEQEARSRFEEEITGLVAENREIKKDVERKRKIQKLLKAEVRKLNVKMNAKNRNFKNQLQTQDEKLQVKITENGDLEDKTSTMLKVVTILQKQHKSLMEADKAMDLRLKKVRKSFDAERKYRNALEEKNALLKESVDLKSTLIDELKTKNEWQREELNEMNGILAQQQEELMAQVSARKKAYDDLKVYTDKVQKCLAEERKKNMKQQ